MDRREFLQHLYQFCEGRIELRALPSKETFFSNDLDALDDWIDSRPDQQIYYGVATRDDSGRGTRDNCLEVPALWVDVDFKDCPKEIVWDLLKKFPHKPSVLVKSGGGVHIYWMLKEPALPDDFDKVEDANKRIIGQLNGDRSAFDVPRILRPPNTANLKYDPPRAVEVAFSDLSLRYEIDDFLSILPEPEQAKSSDHKEAVGENGDALNSIMACAFMQHCRESAASLPEPEWYAMISQLAHRPGGPALIHQLSRPYPKYSPKETDKKILQAVNASRPHTCLHIKGLWDCGKSCGVQSPAALCFKHAAKSTKDVSMDHVYDARRMVEEYKSYIRDLANNKFITGVHEIDKRIRGVSGGEVLTILARAGSFKTAFLQNMLLRYTQNSRHGAIFFSIEMPVSSVTERYLEIVFGHDGRTIEDIFRHPNQEFDNLSEMVNEFADELKNFYVVPVKVSLDKIASYVQMVEKEQAIRIGVVGIDYLGLMDGTGRDEYEQVSRLARGLKDLAKMLNIPVVLLSQINRDGGEGKQEVALHMGRSSGAIEEAADFVLGMWQHQIAEDTRQLICRILKNRKGPPGSTWRLDLDARNLRIGRDAEPFQPNNSSRCKGM